MAQRLLVITHARAGSARDALFGDQGSLVGGAEVAPVDGTVGSWVCGPERACVETVELLGGRARIERGLRAPDVGGWEGRTLSQVIAEDPDGIRSWLIDPDAAPHGGESLSAALERVGLVCDRHVWPDGRTALVVTPAVARLLAIHGLGGGAELAFRLDLRFGGRFELSRTDRGWRLLLG